MYRIKVKKTPNAEMQKGGQNRRGQEPISKNMGKSDGPSNVNVESGETAIGDINNDTFLELMSFQGKRHTEGGIDVNLPEGTFIFSDTKDLKIEDEDILKEMFNLGKKKKGWTPADISKKFQINDYIDVIKNPESSAIAKRSAEKMLEKNVNKLGQLALVQESMKGFPDGIPAIAEPAMKSMGVTPEMMMGSQQQSQEPTYEEYMKCGGSKKKMQDGGEYNEIKKYLDANPETSSIFKEAINADSVETLAKYIKYFDKDVEGMGVDKTSDQYIYDQILKALKSKESKLRLSSDKGVTNAESVYKKGAEALYKTKLKRYNEFKGNAIQKETLKKDLDYYKKIIIDDNLSHDELVEKLGPVETVRDLLNQARSNADLGNVQKAQSTPSASHYKAITDEVSDEEIQDFKKPTSKSKATSSKLDIPSELKEHIKWDPKINKYRINTQGANYTQKRAMDDYLKTNNLYGKVMQSGASKIGSKHSNFYGGLSPQDFEEKYAIETLGADKASKLNKQEKRDLFLTELGLHDYVGKEVDYNNEDFNSKFYAAFKDKFAKGEYRDVLGDDSKYGFEHWDAMRFDKIDTSVKKDAEKEVELYDGPIPKGMEPDKVGRKTGWWTPDIVNMVGALTDDVNKYYPTMGKVDMEAPDYVTLDPTRKLAANQENTAQLLDFLENTGQGFGAAMAATGQGFVNAANVIGDVENQNVGIVNQAMANASNIQNKENAINEELRMKYNDQLATMNQQYDNATNQRKQKVINAFNTGFKNASETSWLTEMYPQYDINTKTGEFMFMGSRDMDNPYDTYYPPYMNPKNSQADPSQAGQQMTDMMKSFTDSGIDETIAGKMVSDYFNNNRRKNYREPNFGARPNVGFGN